MFSNGIRIILNEIYQTENASKLSNTAALIDILGGERTPNRKCIENSETLQIISYIDPNDVQHFVATSVSFLCFLCVDSFFFSLSLPLAKYGSIQTKHNNKYQHNKTLIFLGTNTHTHTQNAEPST